MTEALTSDNVPLSVNGRRRRRVEREAAEVGEGIRRMVVALGRRAADSDVLALVELEAVADAVQAAEQAAVGGLRAVGFSDGEVGRELGVSRQAVRQRWPRGSDQSGLTTDDTDGGR
jgi:DNA-directed RNA polymerase specialized sigma24 family protein